MSAENGGSSPSTSNLGSSAAPDVGPANRTSALVKALRFDLPASLVVFLVALPLCMGIALACGLPVSAGILTGIIGGLVVGFFSGSPLQVSGPAAGVIILVHQVVVERGISDLALILVLAGGIQIAAGL